MSETFSINVYSIHDPCDTLFFITDLVARKFDVYLDILNQPYIVSTLWEIRLLQRGFIGTSL